MITFGMVCIVLGVVLFVLALPRNLEKIELEGPNIKANLPEITGWSRFAVFILGILLIILGFAIGVAELFRSISIPNSTVAFTIPTAVPVLTNPVTLTPIIPTSTSTSIPANPTSTFIPEVTNTETPSPTATNTPQIQATNTQPTVLQPPVPTIHGESVSSETLARIVGGDARYWKQAGGVVWVYSNENNNTTMRHPGENMVLTYWVGFGEPQNADSCQSIISPKNAFEIAVKCKSGTNAQIVADQVGLHIVDDTGFFP